MIYSKLWIIWVKRFNTVSISKCCMLRSPVFLIHVEVLLIWWFILEISVTNCLKFLFLYFIFFMFFILWLHTFSLEWSLIFQQLALFFIVYVSIFNTLFLHYSCFELIWRLFYIMSLQESKPVLSSFTNLQSLQIQKI